MWKQYEPFIRAIVDLFHPFVEAAVHDLKKGKVVALFHNISQREVGQASPLKELAIETEEFPDYFAPYYKQNWDGKALKCTSITIRDTKGIPVGLICFNVDVSFFQDSHRLLETFLKIKPDAENPIEIFGGEAESVISGHIERYLAEHGQSLSHLSRSQKRDLVQDLYNKGIFNFKLAAPYIAKTLQLSRATVYNYLKQFS